MRIGYLILAHAHPQQLARLIARLATPDTRFFVHVDANTSPEIYQTMQAEVVACTNTVVHWVSRRPCRWGGFSLVDATLHMMRTALEAECDWCILLSGQDYPIKRNSAIYKHLRHSEAAGYIDSRSMSQFDVRNRYELYHPERWQGTLLGRIFSKTQRGMRRLGWHRRPPFPLAEIRVGSQWWMLSAAACHCVLDLIARQPHIVEFFRSTQVPDEMFFQTLLQHSPLASRIAHDALRQIEWGEGAWSPRTFTAEDVPRLVEGPALFARKFAPEGEVTSLIDAALERAPCSPC